MAGLLETLDFDAEVKDSNHRSASRRLENSVDPAVNGYLFRTKQEKTERLAPPFICYIQDTICRTPDKREY